MTKIIREYNSPNQPKDLADELPLVAIVEFILEYWKTITGFTLLGIAGAGIYLWVVPKQYEAIAQIKMAQIVNSGTINSNLNPIGINIEESPALIARMSLPSAYTKESAALCGLKDKKNAETLIVKKVKFSIPKGVSGVVELKILDSSQDVAQACLNAVFQLIKSSQIQLTAPFIDETNKKLRLYEERLSRATQMIVKADRSGEAVGAVYLSTRDEIRYLFDQISNLQSIVAGKEMRVTQLTVPIYLNEEPVFPPKRKSLVVGLLLGGFLGLVLALAHKSYRCNRAALKR